jgi:hypothetical protein
LSYWKHTGVIIASDFAVDISLVNLPKSSTFRAFSLLKKAHMSVSFFTFKVIKTYWFKQNNHPLLVKNKQLAYIRSLD